VAEVKVTIGEGRAVVQNEGGACAIFCLNLSVKVDVFPMIYAPWFALH
jgi:hypothetical protein